jgi:hypothetical protein
VIDLVLDTSIFRKDRNRQSPAFMALTRLLQAKKVTLHLPEWVKREVLSQLEEDAQAGLATLSSAARGLKDVAYMEEVLTCSKDLQNRIAELKDAVRKHHGNSFNEWLSVCSAVEYSTKPDHLARLTEAYFGGHPPFSKAKNRADIPDALIWQTVMDISQTCQPLHVVVADKRLRSCAESVNGIFVYETLPQFIQSEPCQGALKELDEDNVAENSTRAVSLLKLNADAWIDQVRDNTKLALKGSSFHDNDVPTGDHLGQVVSVGDTGEFEFQIDLTEYYGNGEIEVPFTAFSQCRIQYKLPVSTYEELPINRAEGIDILELDPFTYLAEEEASLLVAAMLNIKFEKDEFKQPNLLESALLDHVERAETGVKVSDVTILDLL